MAKGRVLVTRARPLNLDKPLKQKERPLLVARQRPLHAQPSNKGVDSAAVKAGSRRLRVPIVIQITEFAIGTSLPEQSLSALSFGTGFARRGEPGR